MLDQRTAKYLQDPNEATRLTQCGNQANIEDQNRAEKDFGSTYLVLFLCTLTEYGVRIKLQQDMYNIWMRQLALPDTVTKQISRTKRGREGLLEDLLGPWRCVRIRGRRKRFECNRYQLSTVHSHVLRSWGQDLPIATREVRSKH